jgi:hypothetical protein
MMSLNKATVRIASLLFPTMLILAVGSLLYLATGKGTPDMKQSAFASDSLTAKPLIDSRVPKKLDTATFALG